MHLTFEEISVKNVVFSVSVRCQVGKIGRCAVSVGVEDQHRGCSEGNIKQELYPDFLTWLPLSPPNVSVSGQLLELPELSLLTRASVIQ